jgi:hypothetical protein
MSEPREAFVHLRIQNPLVAWLVYRAEIVSGGVAHESTLSFWLMNSLRNVAVRRRRAVYQAELELEAQRARRFPGAVPRLRGFYAFDDTESAQRAVDTWGSFSSDNLAAIGISPDSDTSRHDAEWITHHLGQDQSSDWMDSYLAGKARGADPIWELLIDGRAIIYGTTLRKAAYGVVKRVWPVSLPLLELSRMGAPDDLRVVFTMSFADAKNPDFLEQLGSFEGPKNTNDLTPDSDLVLPDLRSLGFKLSA